MELKSVVNISKKPALFSILLAFALAAANLVVVFLVSTSSVAGILGNVFGTFISAGLFLLGIISFLNVLLIFGWSGKRAANNGLGIFGGAVSGALVGCIFGVANTAFTLIQNIVSGILFGSALGLSSMGQNAESAAAAGLIFGATQVISLLSTLACAFVVIPAYMALGAVFGAIGAFISKPKINAGGKKAGRQTSKNEKIKK